MKFKKSDFTLLLYSTPEDNFGDCRHLPTSNSKFFFEKSASGHPGIGWQLRLGSIRSGFKKSGDFGTLNTDISGFRNQAICVLKHQQI